MSNERPDTARPADDADDAPDAAAAQRDAARNAPVVAYTKNADGTLRPTFVFENFADISGYPIDGILSDDGFWLAHIHADDRPLVLQTHSRLKPDGRMSLTYRFLKHNGEYIWLREDLTAIGDPNNDGHVSGYIIDVSDLVLAEYVARDSEARFREIAESSPVGFVTVRADTMQILFCNQHFGDFLDYWRFSIFNESFMSFVCDTAELQKALGSATETKSKGRDIRYLTKSGDVRFGLTSVRTCTYLSFDAYQIAIMDVTEIRQAAEQLMQSTKLATLGQMATGIAHEINQPLSIVRMTAETLSMDIEDSDVTTQQIQKSLGIIADQSDRMVWIVDHMRSFSRREDNDLTSFDPSEPINCAIEFVSGDFRASGIQLYVRVEPSKKSVRASPIQIEQVVLNLLSNARDALEEKILREDQTGFVPTLSVLMDDSVPEVFVIEISDNADGIPEDILPNIFDPFFTTKIDGKGTGLGLSISQSIINSFGGHLSADSSRYGGTTVRIILPVDQEPAGTGNEAAPTPATRKQTATGENGHILVVDDEPLAAEAIAGYMRKWGYDVTVAFEGNAGLEAYQSRPRWDAIITDLRMPKMDGFTLIKEIRRRGDNLPIIAVTGHISIGDDKRVVAEGASAMLAKPLRLNDLYVLVQELTAAAAS